MDLREYSSNKTILNTFFKPKRYFLYKLDVDKITKFYNWNYKLNILKLFDLNDDQIKKYETLIMNCSPGLKLKLEFSLIQSTL